MTIRTLTAALLLIAAGGAAQAASLTLMPSAGTVAQNGSFTVDLMLDAADVVPGANPRSFGGEILVDFDATLLNYTGFSLASGVSFYLAPSVTNSGNMQTVRLGFDNAPDMSTVGTFSFTALGGPGSLATLGLADGDDFSGSFASYAPTYQRFFPDLAGAQINVVPLPAGVWLLGTAIGALAVRRRLRHATA
jgi:hypothetical protein